MLSMGGGVSGAIAFAGGKELEKDVVKITKRLGANAGDVIVTCAGALPAKYILHAVTIGRRHQEMSDEIIVRQASQKVMRLMPLLGCRSVAFPAIGAGAGAISYEVVASQLASVLVETLLGVEEQYQVELYLFDRWGKMNPEELFSFFESIFKQKLGLATRKGESTSVLEAPLEMEREAADANEAQRRQNIFTMLRDLDNRRNELEARLLNALTQEDAAAKKVLAELRHQLEEIQKLRGIYETELMPIVKSPAMARSVFLSSTSSDLQPYRKAVREVIEKQGLQFIGMEEFSPSAKAPGELIRQKVNQAEIYFGVLGMRYGCVDPNSGLSMTELEYRQAVASQKPIYIFVMDKSAPITAEMVEASPEGYCKLLDFKEQVMKLHTCSLFTTPENLAQKAEKALQEIF